MGKQECAVEDDGTERFDGLHLLNGCPCTDGDDVTNCEVCLVVHLDNVLSRGRWNAQLVHGRCRGRRRGFRGRRRGCCGRGRGCRGRGRGCCGRGRSCCGCGCCGCGCGCCGRRWGCPGDWDHCCPGNNYTAKFLCAS